MIATASLLDKSACRVFLQHQQKRIHAPNLKVTASMMMKKYAQVLPPRILDPMIFEKQGKAIPISACHLSEDLELFVDESRIYETKSVSDAWDSLFANHLTRVLMAFHSTTNLPTHILWENIAVRLNSYLRKAVEQYPEHNERIIEVAEELHSLSGDSFKWDTHPISAYLTPLTALTDQRKRKTCCYYHKLDKEKEMTHCLVCPLKCS
ncbi:IucA/IucC family C-terminal-domain containing protein [Virgibacillus flavescens]|uniref:IucA/IucC family C-terminal-domain containing protein n=1 Tax=Virgibacillus flavescens TaxID=1611422 RepID=UPI003D342967